MFYSRRSRLNYYLLNSNVGHHGDTQRDQCFLSCFFSQKFENHWFIGYTVGGMTRTFLTAFVKLSVPSIGPLLEKQGNDKGQIQDWWMLFLFLAELLEEEKINNRHPH